MTQTRKDGICALLKGIETGDPEPIAIVNPDTYIQHNPQTHEGGEGLEALFKRLSKTSPRVNIVRIFSDGDFVFGHTEYDFSTSRIGFEVFRFEGDQTVEHWDNIQLRQGPNPSGHTMVDGPTEVDDVDQTDANREQVRAFTEEILIHGRLNSLSNFIDETYTEHNPRLRDGRGALESALSARTTGSTDIGCYRTLHRLLAEGNFVLSVCEGHVGDTVSSFYDLYRISDGKIVEHWDTRESVPPKSEWKNDNGKF